jgi:hypothetical protein
MKATYVLERHTSQLYPGCKQFRYKEGGVEIRLCATGVRAYFDVPVTARQVEFTIENRRPKDTDNFQVLKRSHCGRYYGFSGMEPNFEGDSPWSAALDSLLIRAFPKNKTLYVSVEA